MVTLSRQLAAVIVTLLLCMSTKYWSKHGHAPSQPREFNTPQKRGTPMQDVESLNYISADLTDGEFLNYDRDMALPLPNSHISKLFSLCSLQPSIYTNHVRLSTVRFMNISMLPPSLDKDTASSRYHQQYFNPAIIPLPSHSEYPYVLISRLVTSGLHQESHICFADVCSSDVTEQRLNHRACTLSDMLLLGSRGGMRCMTVPEKISIPPTPARRCTDNWATFPDIPGFHDPRAFWSGSGEPLIQVNSASQYGCVGLWLQDLRQLFPSLKEILIRDTTSMYVRQHTAEEASPEDMDLGWLGPPTRYRYVTEITRNPRQSRTEVEKNWVLFFPTPEETWVQYDLMGSIDVSKTHDDYTESEDDIELLNLAKVVDKARNISTVNASDMSATQAAPHILNSESSSRVAVRLDRDIWSQPTTSSSQSAGLEKSAARNRGTTIHGTTTETTSLYSSHSDENPADNVSAENWNYTRAESTNDIQTFLTLPYDTAEPNGTISGGRTLAKLSSHAFTSTNLTHHHEQSCFSLHSPDHTRDALNNTGHWHQSTPSLRLTLCTRVQFRARTCHDISNLAINHNNTHNMPSEEYERLLRREGLVVHISIVHRKFSNGMSLPMRYERYFAIWEARAPFLMTAVSQYPILFGEELAQPWTKAENLGVTSDILKRSTSIISDREGRSEHILDGVYFAYTPSLSWAWRSESVSDAAWNRRQGHEDLGTGYLDDELLVGVGFDDVAQGYVQLPVAEALQCLRICGQP